MTENNGVLGLNMPSLWDAGHGWPLADASVALGEHTAEPAQRRTTQIK
jgi:hypothetical protein